MPIEEQAIDPLSSSLKETFKHQPRNLILQL